MRIPRAHKSILLSNLSFVNISGPIPSRVPWNSIEGIVYPFLTKSKSANKGYPSDPIKILSVFRSQYKKPLWWRYYSARITPAKINLIPCSPSFRKESPLPLVDSRKEVKSLPSANLMPW